MKVDFGFEIGQLITKKTLIFINKRFFCIFVERILRKMDLKILNSLFLIFMPFLFQLCVLGRLLHHATDHVSSPL